MNRIYRRCLSVGLSLVLCTSMIIPSFAASFTDLNNALYGQNGVVIGGTERVGYGNDISEAQDQSKFEIEAWDTGKDGETIRNIQMNTDVVFDIEKDYNGEILNMHSDLELNGVYLKENLGIDKVVLDLNGKNLDNSSHVEVLSDPEQQGSSVVWMHDKADLTIKDTSENQTGTITGAANSGIWANDSKLTLEGVTLVGNGTIYSEGTAVTIENNSVFNMTSGTIISDANDSGKAAVEIRDCSSFTMTGGTINTLDDKVSVKTNLEDGSSSVVVRGDLKDLDGVEIAEGSKAVFNEKNGLYHVGPESEEKPNTPDKRPDTSTSTSDEKITEIEPIDTPLVEGPMTRGEFINHIWKAEGSETGFECSFKDVDAGYEFIEALAWAEHVGVISADEDGNFNPDELITVKDVRLFLDNFNTYKNGNYKDIDSLETLKGEAEEIVPNCEEVLKEFFESEK